MTNYSKEYIELIRKKSHDLRDIGIFYKTMAIAPSAILFAGIGTE